jgi:hypothetical protein
MLLLPGRRLALQVHLAELVRQVVWLLLAWRRHAGSAAHDGRRAQLWSS